VKKYCREIITALQLNMNCKVNLIPPYTLSIKILNYNLLQRCLVLDSTYQGMLSRGRIEHGKDDLCQIVATNKTDGFPTITP